MSPKRSYRRGDVYLADCGVYSGSVQGGVRPVVIIQNDIGNRHSPTVCVAKLSSRTNKKPNQPTHYVVPESPGLAGSSVVMAEQIVTLNKTDLMTYITHLSKRHMHAISKCVAIELDLLDVRKPIEYVMDTGAEVPGKEIPKKRTRNEKKVGVTK